MTLSSVKLRPGLQQRFGLRDPAKLTAAGTLTGAAKVFVHFLRQGLQALAGSGSVECTSRRLESEPAADNVQH